MAFQSAQNTDARHAIFNAVGGNQYNGLIFNIGSKEDALKKLEPVVMDGSRRTGCLERTRADVLTLVIQWASDHTSKQRILWIHGPAGSGKSTISNTLADHFRRSKQLGAFLFFDRDVTERSNPALVTRTLAYQLSSFHPDIGGVISAAIESSPQTVTSSLSCQFQELLIDTLSCVESLPTKSQIVLVLDALDECGSRKDRIALVEALAEKSAHLPSAFRFVITSRPDIDIQLAFESQSHVLGLELDLTSASIKGDILLYFRHHMDIIQKKKKHLGIDWPGAKNINALARRASGLFIWASIACNFIDAHDPQKRLDIVLQGDITSTAEVALDDLYRKALDSAGTWDDEDFVVDFRAVFGIILFLRNPLTSTAIDNLLADPDGRPSAQTIEQLSCIVSSKPRIRLIHPTLADFLTSRSRCGREIWFFAPARHERTLAILCLHRLEQVLHRDMSQPALSVDEDDHPIPKDVAYACMFWVDHIYMIKDDMQPIDHLLKTFIDQHVLHWFEAMSLLKRFGRVTRLFDQLSEWIQRHSTPGRQSLLELIRYWWRFSLEYETRIQEYPMQAYSEELLREFQIIEVQEPLISRPVTPSILDLSSLPHNQTLPNVSSRRNSSSSSTSGSMSPCLSNSPDLIPPVSYPASPDLTRFGRRLSRSSLNLSLSRNSSSPSMSRSASPCLRNSFNSTPSVSRSASPDHHPQYSHSVSNLSSQQNCLRTSPSSQPTSSGLPDVQQCSPSSPEAKSVLCEDDEHTKKLQEGLHKERDRRDSERQSRSEISLNQGAFFHVVETHERLQANLHNADELSWDSFPWPMLVKPDSPDDLTLHHIGAFVLFPHYRDDKPTKDRIKEHISMWHPGHFEAKYLPKVRLDEYEKVREGDRIVIRALDELLARCNIRDLPTNVHPHQSNDNSHRRNTSAYSGCLVEEPIVVTGIPSVSIQDDQMWVGNSQSSPKSIRSYTPLKVLGDGSFATIWLCDWHGTLPPNTPLSPMQCGAGARSEWVGKRLVAIKIIKKKLEGGWDECQNLKEIQSLRAIPFHPNIIPLYDWFLSPSNELFFVFESMEGNLYQFIKARKGRALAGGLVAATFRQIVSGLSHIHSCGYFHRDMKPENILVTTTGLHDYQSVSPIAPPSAPLEKDVAAIIKLADFGLARETKSKPPYTEYISTRWHRAPEVLLLSRDYSSPVDMWALGTIMAQLVNLQPLFPGSGQIDQMARICDLLGDPSDEYGPDGKGKAVGGGKWPKGIKMAKALGFAFPKIQPKNIYSLFDRTVPSKLIECIADLLKYDPEARLTSQQCLEHPYLLETIPQNSIPVPAALQMSISPPVLGQSHQPNGISQAISLSSGTPRYASHHVLLHDSKDSSDNNSRQYERTQDVTEEYHYSHDVELNSMTRAVIASHNVAAQPPGSKHGKFDSFRLKKLSSKLGTSRMFGQTDQLELSDEMPITASSSSAPGLKSTQFLSTNSHSLSEMPPTPAGQTNPKKAKKEAERLEREAQQQRRALAEKAHREQARAVMQMRNQFISGHSDQLDWKYRLGGSMVGKQRPGAPATSKHGTCPEPIRENQDQNTNRVASTFDDMLQNSSGWRRDGEVDDNHSTSSSTLKAFGLINFRRDRPEISSLASSSFFSLSESQSQAQDFHNWANINSSSLPGERGTTISPPTPQTLSLPPSPSWMSYHASDDDISARREHPNFVPLYSAIPQHPSGMDPGGPNSPHKLDCSVRSHPSSSGTINPIFNVPPPTPSGERVLSPTTLPPFSQLEAAAELGDL